MAAQPAVVEDEIDAVVLVADGDAELPRLETETGAEFEEEALRVIEERGFEIVFRVGRAVGEPGELQDVGIAVTPALGYTGLPPRFAFTTRLAFREANNVAELLLIREPERRFYRECRLAGLDVAVYEESGGDGQVFDIGQLRLRFVVSRKDERTETVRFNSATARFQVGGTSFSGTPQLRTDS